MPVKALVVPNLHVPRIVGGAQEDLNIDSGGEIALSMPLASRALVVKTPSDGETVVDTRTKDVEFKTPTALFVSQDSANSASSSIANRAGSKTEGELSSIVKGSKDVNTGASTVVAGTGSRDGDSTQGTYIRFGAASTKIASPGESIAINKSGGIEYRANEHSFSLEGVNKFAVREEHIRSEVDIDILGTMSSVEGTLRIVQIEDPEIKLATTAQVDSNLTTEPTGVTVKTVPCTVSDAEYMSRYRAEDSSALFVDEATDVIDVPKAVSADIFDKTIAYDVNGGMRSAGARSADSRLADPSWNVAGSALRISRVVPDMANPGMVILYTMNLRVTDEGGFEVNRMKMPLEWDESTGTYFASAPELVVLHELLPKSDA